MTDRPRRGFVAAAQFLTRVPIGTAVAPDARHMTAWFPVVGALVGAAVGAVAAGLGELV
ncbi:MAG: adenosylcobinamide-GDP ribazoletransferase, partial [Acidimicrobiia bacterium]|nr:adenosylcobinamide-GDP ribazoletransferase [Acidimicrobiia bacterium]